MSDNTYKLFELCNKTLDMMQSKSLNEEAGYKVLHTLTGEMEDKKELYSSLNYLSEYATDFWYANIFKTNEDILDFLIFMAQKECFNNELVSKLMDGFLKMPTEVKKNFYETNFVEFTSNQEKLRQFVLMSGKKIVEANLQTTFHNLPSIYLQSSPIKPNYEMFEIVCEDVKKTMGMSQSEFLGVYGTAIIHCLDSRHVIKNWHKLEMDKRRDLQEMYATKFYNKGTLRNWDFLLDVEKGLLPYDLQLPGSGKYLMNDVISNEFSRVVHYMVGYSFDPGVFSDTVNSVIESIQELNKKYDLSMFTSEAWSQSRDEISACFERNFRMRGKAFSSSVEAEILSLFLSIDGLINGKKDKITKKVKV